jgi:short-subunit dehydrogenase involved in D-alanine esterification of teichoic acids
MTYAFLPLLVGKDDAVIMNVTSALAFVPFPMTPTYSATKAALHSFSQSLRIQLAGANAGVQVIEVAPPSVDQAIWKSLNGNREASAIALWVEVGRNSVASPL